MDADSVRAGSWFSGFSTRVGWFQGLGLAVLLAGIEALFLMGFRRALGGAGFALLPVLLALAGLRLPVQWGMARLEAWQRARAAALARLRILRAVRRRQVSCAERDLRATLHVALSAQLPRAIEGWQAGRSALSAALQLVVLVPVAVWAAPQIAWLFLPITLPAYAMVRLKSRVLRRQAAATRAAHAGVESHLETWLDGLEGLLANGTLGREAMRDMRLFHGAMFAQGRWHESQAVFPAWMELFFFAALALIAAWVSGHLGVALLGHGAGDGVSNPGVGLHEWVVLGGALLLAYRPLRELAKAWPHYLAGKGAASEVQALLQAWSKNPLRRRPALSPTAQVQLVGVTFAYPEGRPVLRHCHAAFPLRRITGIEGPNGAGKTTLLRLLAGLEIPNQGEVLWPEALRAQGHVAYLPQRLWLPTDLPQRCEAWQGRHPERFARLEDVLGTRALRRRPHFDVREFSGGERQRLALLMTLMSDAPFLLLDEPTSFLPGHERQVLLGRLLDCWREADGPQAPLRGGVVVAHEPFLGELCDQLVRLEARAPDEGPAAESLTPQAAATQTGESET
jgi:energy-coupling factor transport system ATP-binding protein